MFKKSAKPRYDFSKDYQMKTSPELIEKAHKAIARAAQQYKDGWISLSDKRRIDSKANRIINSDFKDPLRPMYRHTKS